MVEFETWREVREFPETRRGSVRGGDRVASGWVAVQWSPRRRPNCVRADAAPSDGTRHPAPIHLSGSPRRINTVVYVCASQIVIADAEVRPRFK